MEAVVSGGDKIAPFALEVRKKAGINNCLGFKIKTL